MIRTPLVLLGWTLSLAATFGSGRLQAADWTYWRGPTMNGVSGEKNLPDEWNPEGGEGSNLVWKRTDLGSRSTPVVMDGRLYMTCRHHPEIPTEQQEKVVCLDAATGETLWENIFNVYLSDVPQERVGWSSVVADPETGNVYALGVCGYFQCINGKTGETVWAKSMHEQFGQLSTYGGRTNFPIIHEDNVIISGVVIGWGDTSRPTHRFHAFDKHNGQPVWQSGTTPLPFDTTYSAPVLGVLGGELAMVFGSGDGGFHAMQPRTGKKLWSYKVSSAGANVSPLIVGDRVYAGHSEENIDSSKVGAVFCLDGTKRGELMGTDGEIWRQTEILVGRSSPLLIGDRLYAIDDRAKLHVFNAETGEVIGTERLGTMMRSNPLYADGKIYTCETNGRWYILKPSEAGVEVIHKMRMASGEECHGSPIAVNGRIYFPTTDAMYCIGKPGEAVAADPLPAMPVEAERSLDTVPAQLLVAPVDGILKPGGAQQYQVRLYNAKGQYLRTARPDEVQFSLTGDGTIDPQGRLETGTENQKQHPVIVTAKVGEISGQARVRVVPDLDWAYNFDDGEVPATWIALQYRHIVIDYDLLTKLRAEDPRAADLYIYLRTGFVNTGAPAQTFDDSTSRQLWTQLLRFLNLLSSEDKPQNVEDAKEKLDPSLKRLQDEKVIAGFEWTTWDRPTGNGDETVPEPRLKVMRGERKVDGNGVLCKITTIPLGTRSQGWMGWPLLSDYTLQADVMATDRGRMPDIGMIGQRYTLDLMGIAQKLEIRTWTAQLDRFSVSAPFAWEPNVWYTLKFRTSVEDGKAVLRGKVWKKGDEEPADWTVTGEDSLPNLTGSPGLFGNSKDSEVFYDNLTITRNNP